MARRCTCAVRVWGGRAVRPPGHDGSVRRDSGDVARGTHAATARRLRSRCPTKLRLHRHAPPDTPDSRGKGKGPVARAEGSELRSQAHQAREERDAHEARSMPHCGDKALRGRGEVRGCHTAGARRPSVRQLVSTYPPKHVPMLAVPGHAVGPQWEVSCRPRSQPPQPPHKFATPSPGFRQLHERTAHLTSRARAVQEVRKNDSDMCLRC